MKTFILDVHLGKLARHLRMLGFDTAWDSGSPDSSDPELLKRSREEGRILLTRDRLLHDSADPDLRHYVHATDPREQLIEVLDRFSLREDALSGRFFLSRCLDCNSPILPVRGDQLVDRLPGQVRLEHSQFFLCPRCERVYWKGSHFARMWEWVKKL
jgi:uncharacterized protein with PIN domain